MSSTDAVQGTEENAAGAGTLARCRAFLTTYSRMILPVFCSLWGLLLVCIWGAVGANSSQRSIIIVCGSVVMVLSLSRLVLLCTSEFPPAAAEPYLVIVLFVVCSFPGLLVFCISISISTPVWERVVGVAASLILMAVIGVLGYLTFFSANEPEESEDARTGEVQEDTGKSEIELVNSRPAMSVRTRRGDLPRTPIPPAGGSEERGESTKSGPLPWIGKGKSAQSPIGREERSDTTKSGPLPWIGKGKSVQFRMDSEKDGRGKFARDSSGSSSDSSW